ncbi:hypothetical protein BC830DRAFT_1104350 [Chytriomyces sp. MP71]|nr:hypothetical protein BC830DRAFT_1104350 [Chytriomyces sp. MP71]
MERPIMLSLITSIAVAMAGFVGSGCSSAGEVLKVDAKLSLPLLASMRERVLRLFAMHSDWEPYFFRDEWVA